MEIEFKCIACSQLNQFEFEKKESDISCKSCGKSYSSVQELMAVNGGLQKCLCGCRDLYIQKDFNRKVGLAIVAIGAVLAPFTKFISLLVCALIDLILYKSLPFVTICYKCGSIYRDFPSNPDHRLFNLGINDRYRSQER
jgi:hypothetical protein